MLISYAGNVLGEEVTSDDLRELNLPVIQESRGGGEAPQQTGIVPVIEGETRAESRKEVRQFVLSEALPVVPARLVKRILKSEFVEMNELLKDNMEVERRRGLEGTSQSQYFQRGNRREVPDLLSWIQCFSLYAAVVASRYPEKTKELWAYQATIIAEAQRCGGRGFVSYDSTFRQQMLSFESTDFSRINQSLYSTTFLSMRGKGQCCSMCNLPDHGREDCALNPSRTVPVVHMKESAAPTKVDPRGGSGEPRRKRPRRGACFAWNDGSCKSSSESCKFEHVCSYCFGNHRRPFCKSRPAEGSGRREETPNQMGLN